MDNLFHLLSEYGLWVVFIGMIVEGTAVIILSGVLCHMGLLPCELTLIVAISGAIVGDQMWFYIGHNYAQKFISKFQKIEKKIEKVRKKVQSKADILALTSRFIYGGAIAFPFVLGMHNYSHKKFTILDAIGVSFASIVGLSIGYFLSSSFQKVLGYINHFEYMILFVFILFVSVKLYNSTKRV